MLMIGLVLVETHEIALAPQAARRAIGGRHEGPQAYLPQ